MNDDNQTRPFNRRSISVSLPNKKMHVRFLHGQQTCRNNAVKMRVSPVGPLGSKTVTTNKIINA